MPLAILYLSNFACLLQEEIEAQKKEWELGHLKSLKEEHERAASGSDDSESDEILTMSREDASQVNNSSSKKSARHSKLSSNLSTGDSRVSKVSITPKSNGCKVPATRRKIDRRRKCAYKYEESEDETDYGSEEDSADETQQEDVQSESDQEASELETKSAPKTPRKRGRPPKLNKRVAHVPARSRNACKPNRINSVGRRNTRSTPRLMIALKDRDTSSTSRSRSGRPRGRSSRNVSHKDKNYREGSSGSTSVRSATASTGRRGRKRKNPIATSSNLDVTQKSPQETRLRRSSREVKPKPSRRLDYSFISKPFHVRRAIELGRKSGSSSSELDFK